mgnify:CR=1 FL=1
MGGKPQPQMPPAVDTSVQDKLDTSEAKLAAEKSKAMGVKKKVNMVLFLHLEKV